MEASKIMNTLYNFKNDYLIYNEIDYNLLVNESRKFHRLFTNNNDDLNFIKTSNFNSLNLDKSPPCQGV